MANVIFDKGVILKKRLAFQKILNFAMKQDSHFDAKRHVFQLLDKVFKKQPENSKFDPM